MLQNIEYSKNTSTKRPERAALHDLTSTDELVKFKYVCDGSKLFVWSVCFGENSFIRCLKG